MCGIAGVLNPSKSAPETAFSLAKTMISTLVHRGPDDHAVWCHPKGNLALGFRRLSILDLSLNGRQPMRSRDQRLSLVFNGEIYNYRSLRSELSSHYDFVSQSDSEVLLAALHRWGVEKTLPRLNGMFAFALWDEQTEKLTLARDRIGEKPLYFGWSNEKFVFASELRALEAVADNLKFSAEGLSLFFRYGYIPAPVSIYERVFKLPPACWFQVGRDGQTQMGQKIAPQPKRYWFMEKLLPLSETEPFSGSKNQASKRLSALLEDSVRLRMQSDVELGAFLSGGLDSSLVVSILARQSTRPVRTYTIGFRDPKHNEAQRAKAISKYLGTEHRELYLDEKQCLELVPKLADIFDEPFADPSLIPTYVVSQLAKKEVTVVLSGDGGDEFFGGYPRYQKFLRMETLRVLPKWGKTMTAEWLRALVRSKRVGSARLRQQIGRVCAFLEGKDLAELYGQLMSYESEGVLSPDLERTPVCPAARFFQLAQSHGVVASMMFTDQSLFLPEDILTKLDRVSMAVSLEARVPFLDPKIVEFAWALPAHYRVGLFESKGIIRRALAKQLPKRLWSGPKRGFSFPLESWMADGLRPWVEQMFNEPSFRQSDVLNSKKVLRLWEAQKRGQSRHPYLIWNILMFQAWLRVRKSRTQANPVVHKRSRNRIESEIPR